MSGKSPITTHVLDTAQGRPAVGVTVVLSRFQADGDWDRISTGTNNADGRLMDLLAPEALTAGRYRLTFGTGDYFRAQGTKAFFPVVNVEFEIADPPAGHYHVPLLLSPFGYSTYRGS